ncbi:MAG: metal ABC transporter substrate-binding protein [Iamia sp.]
MSPRRRLLPVALAALLVVGAAGCGGEGASGSEARPTIVVTTSVLANVVGELVGDEATVEVLVPRGADPHDVALSAREAVDVRSADALITNGAGLEGGMLDTLATAEDDGVATLAAIDAVDPLPSAAGGAHDGDAHDGDEGSIDPHFFTDPDRMADAAEGIAAFLAAEVPALDTDAFRTSAAAEVAALRDLAQEVDDVLAVVPAEDRVLVTSHAVLGYFADRYDLRVAGSVIPGGGTGAEPSGRDLAALAATVEEEGVSAVFTDASSSPALAEALAAEAGGVTVVPLFTESLGPEGSDGATYEAMIRTDAGRIAAALT